MTIRIHQVASTAARLTSTYRYTCTLTKLKKDWGGYAEQERTTYYQPTTNLQPTYYLEFDKARKRFTAADKGLGNTPVVFYKYLLILEACPHRQAWHDTYEMGPRHAIVGQGP
jgi:hypothetical protein